MHFKVHDLGYWSGPSTSFLPDMIDGHFPGSAGAPAERLNSAGVPADQPRQVLLLGGGCCTLDLGRFICFAVKKSSCKLCELFMDKIAQSERV